MKIEPIIRLYLEPPCLTVEEYEDVARELETKSIVDELSIGDRILLKLIVNHHWRYQECKAQINN